VWQSCSEPSVPDDDIARLGPNSGCHSPPQVPTAKGLSALPLSCDGFTANNRVITFYESVVGKNEHSEAGSSSRGNQPSHVVIEANDHRGVFVLSKSFPPLLMKLLYGSIIRRVERSGRTDASDVRAVRMSLLIVDANSLPQLNGLLEHASERVL